MILLGTIVNTASILAGGAAGLLLRKILSKRLTDTVMQGVGLAVLVIGMGGALGAAFKVAGSSVTSEHILLMVVSMAVGGLAGELLNIENKLDAFARFCERKLVKPGETSTFAQGFVTAMLVFCVGSMAIVGAMEDGMRQNRDILFAKSVLDGISAMIFASTMGAGVLFAAAAVAVYQGGITLLAMAAAPWFDQVLVTQISLIGSVLILAIGLNMLKITKLKVSNLLPAMLVPALWYGIRMLIGVFQK